MMWLLQLVSDYLSVGLLTLLIDYLTIEDSKPQGERKPSPHFKRTQYYKTKQALLIFWPVYWYSVLSNLVKHNPMVTLMQNPHTNKNEVNKLKTQLKTKNLQIRKLKAQLAELKKDQANAKGASKAASPKK